MVPDRDVGRGASRADERMPRRRRVRKRADYLAIQGRGQRLTGTYFLLFARPRPDGALEPRFGVTVSRKVGGAVQRNQVKRWVRESCRRMGADMPAGLDLVFVARPAAAGAGYGPTARELATLARRLRARR
jgi:ribonuclease P protein component